MYSKLINLGLLFWSPLKDIHIIRTEAMDPIVWTA